MKIITILFIISMFIACGGDVSSDGNKKSNNNNTNTNTNDNNNNNNQTSDPGGFGPPVENSGISKPKV